MHKIFLLLLVTILPFSIAKAYDFEISGIEYTKTNTTSGNYTVSITGADTDISGEKTLSTVTYGVTYKITEIGTNAFHSCTSLTSITLPNVTTVGTLAFWGCTSLTSISLPNVTTIGYNAFCNCSSLETIIIGQTNTPDISAGAVFSSIASSSTPTLYVPYSAVSTYEAVTSISNYVSVAPILDIDGITSISLDMTNTSYSLDLSAISQESWEITTSSDWLSFSSTTGTGDNNITVSANDDIITSDRTATFTIEIEDYDEITVTVTQTTTLTAEDIVNKDAIDLDYDNTNGTVTLGSISGKYWAVSSSSDWLSFSSTTGTGDNAITVSTNDDVITSTRTATFTIDIEDYDATSTVTVTQEPTFTVDDIEYTTTSASTAEITDATSVSGDYTPQEEVTCEYINTTLDVTSIGEKAFAESELETIILPNISSIGANAFYNCTKLDSIIMLQNSVSNITSTAFNGVPSTCVLYVPNSAVSTYNDSFSDYITVKGILDTEDIIYLGTNTSSYAFYLSAIVQASWEITSDLDDWLSYSPTTGTGDKAVTISTKYPEKVFTANLTITLAGYDTITVAILQNTTTNIEDDETNLESISIYPNPVSSSFQIKGFEGSASIKIYNISCTLLLSKNVSEEESIDIADFIAGTYLVKIKNNNSVITKRIIKTE